MADAAKMPDQSDPEALQAFLMNGVSSILKSPGAPMSPNTYMEFHATVSKLMNRSSSDVKSTRNQSSCYGVLPGDSICTDLTTVLADHLQPVAEKLESQDDSVLLEAYFAEWDRYTKAAKRIDRLMDLVNRHHVKRSIDKMERGIYPIRLLHFVQWRSQVWEKVSVRVVDSAQRVVEKGGEGAGGAKDMVERLEKLRVDSHAVSGDDERTRIRKSLEAPFVLEVEALDKEVERKIAVSTGHIFSEEWKLKSRQEREVASKIGK